MALWGRRISQKSFNQEFENITSFADLGTSKPVVDALRARSITQPFPDRELVIRDALAGRGLLVQSPTRSGKTLAFGVPLVSHLSGESAGRSLVFVRAQRGADRLVKRLRGRQMNAGRTGTGISFVLADQAKEMRRITASLGLDGLRR